jgi:GMP synthase-like glutamine amidotransferase
MSLRIAILQHERETGLGAFAGLLDEAGVSYRLLDTSDGLPLPDAATDCAIALGASIGTIDATLETRRWISAAVRDDMPFLGICLGAELLADTLGARVVRGTEPALGVHDVFLTRICGHDPLFGGLRRRLAVVGWHQDTFVLPPRATLLATSTGAPRRGVPLRRLCVRAAVHLEARADDLRRWRDVPAYRRLVEDARRDWDALIAAVERATPELDHLARHVLERWLVHAGAVAVHRNRRAWAPA